MILRISLQWKANLTGEIGQTESVITDAKADLKGLYNSMGRPHGAGRQGLAVFITNLITYLLVDHDMAPAVSLGLSPGAPGYSPVVNVEILAEDEKELAPEDALEALYPRRTSYDPGAILAAAEEDENGEQWAYVSLLCRYWTIDPDDLETCPAGEPDCPGHCPYCGSGTIKVLAGYMVDMVIDPDDRATGHAVLASYGPNAKKCYPEIEHYRRLADQMRENIREEGRRRCLALAPGRYAHLSTDHEVLAVRTCPKCNEAAEPVAITAQDSAGGPAKWLLTWLCKNDHYKANNPAYLAPWPFIENYATEADLEAAGFRVIK